jgi:hypothetical protein
MKKFKLIFLIFISVNASAQSKLITIEEAIATALQNNFDIQLSKNDSLVAALDYSYRNAIFFRVSMQPWVPTGQVISRIRNFLTVQKEKEK